MNDNTLDQREAMVREQIAARGVTNPRVLAVMRDIPRERFTTIETRRHAYEDRALPTQDGQTISQPYIVALMCDVARLQPTDRVLEIGTGSGYSAAVVSKMVQRVWTLERNPRLARFSGSRVAEFGLSNVTVLRADGTVGWPPAAPFDVILVTATGPQVPDALKQQLSIGGRLVMPVGPQEGPQKLVRIIREDTDRFTEEAIADVDFVPLISEQD